MVIVTRAYIAEDFAYQATVITDPDPSAAQVTVFLDSFTITSPPTVTAQDLPTSGFKDIIMQGAMADPNCKEEYWVTRVEAAGKSITLNDGSVLEISDADVPGSVKWLRGEDVMNCENLLINLNRKNIVSAQRQE